MHQDNARYLPCRINFFRLYCCCQICVLPVFFRYTSLPLNRHKQLFFLFLLSTPQNKFQANSPLSESYSPPGIFLWHSSDPVAEVHNPCGFFLQTLFLSSPVSLLP